MACPVMQNPQTGEKANGTTKANGQDKPAPGEYIKWDAEGVEVIPDGEQKKIYEVSSYLCLCIASDMALTPRIGFGAVQPLPDDEFGMSPRLKWCTWQQANRRHNEHMHCLRGTHLKTQGVVMGKITVHRDLPKHLAQGMFAQPGTYDVIMRYSSLTPKIVPDNIPAPRGIGMKIFGIEGDKLFGEDKKTQDWTFNNYPILELRDPQTTYDIADSLEKNWNDLGTFAKEQSERVDADVATSGGQLPRQHSKS
ncbi:hypothetical protein LTR10_000448 [Elasticomyces elasticus]|nr:hypothetical protein LTR10_000448 [Elasticomyces elasticus]KAK4980302.1 hypothetical protein LTR42_000609 [Elasticomyces elasticus]